MLDCRRPFCGRPLGRMSAAYPKLEKAIWLALLPVGGQFS